MITIVPSVLYDFDEYERLRLAAIALDAPARLIVLRGVDAGHPSPKSPAISR